MQYYMYIRILDCQLALRVVPATRWKIPLHAWMNSQLTWTTTNVCKTRGISHQSGHSEHYTVKTVPCALSNGTLVTTLCPKNVTTLSDHNSDIHEWIWIMFGTNVTEKVRNQQILYFPTCRNQCTTGRNEERQKQHPFTQMHCQTSTSRWLNLSSLVTYLQLILMLVYDSLNLIVSGVSSGQLWGHSLGERKLRVLHCSSWTVLNARCTGCTVLLKDKVVNVTFVEIVRYPSNIAQ